MIRDDDTFSERIVLRTTCTTEHLKDILGREFDPSTFLRVVNLSSFDDDYVSGQVDTPGESSGRNEDLNTTISEEILDEGTIDSVHTSVVTGESEGEEIFEVGIGDGFGFFREDFSSSGVGSKELSDRIVFDGVISEEFGGLGGFLSRVNEDDDLILPSVFEDLLVTDLVRNLHSLDRLLLGNSDELLLERTRSVGRVEVEETLFRVDVKELGDIFVVGKGS